MKKNLKERPRILNDFLFLGTINFYLISNEITAWVYKVNGGGHDWFGEWGNMDIHSSAVIWSFLSTFCGTTISTNDLIPENGQLFDHIVHPTSKQIELHV